MGNFKMDEEMADYADQQINLTQEVMHRTLKKISKGYTINRFQIIIKALRR